MPSILGNLIAVAALVIVVALAARSLWKEHKNGGSCTGNCASCQGCHGGCHSK